VRFAARKRRRRTGDFTRARCARWKASEWSREPCFASLRHTPGRVRRAFPQRPDMTHSMRHAEDARREGPRGARVAPSRARWRSRVERAPRRAFGTCSKTRAIRVEHRSLAAHVTRQRTSDRAAVDRRAAGGRPGRTPRPSCPRGVQPGGERLRLGPLVRGAHLLWSAAPKRGDGRRAKSGGLCLARELRGAPAVRSRRCGCCGSKGVNEAIAAGHEFRGKAA
jgi:hypothetical protein